MREAELKGREHARASLPHCFAALHLFKIPILDVVGADAG